MQKTRGRSLLAAMLGMAALTGSLLAGPSTAHPFGIGLAAPAALVPVDVGLGVSGKYWLNSADAIDGTLFGGSNYVAVAGDFLWHRYDVFKGLAAKHLPLYFGPGASITAWSSGPYNGTALAAQGKIGVDYLFDAPFDAYVEAIPSLTITPSVGFNVSLSTGGRWYF